MSLVNKTIGSIFTVFFSMVTPSRRDAKVLILSDRLMEAFSADTSSSVSWILVPIVSASSQLMLSSEAVSPVESDFS